MKFIIQFACLLLSIGSFGQIKGSLLSSLKEPIPFANVILYSTIDSSIVSGSSTDEGGEFIINNYKAGTYYLQCSSLGYETFESKSFTIFTENDHYLIEDIVLLENTLLDEVTVSSKKNLIQNTPYGKTINIQTSLLTKGSNLLQVLERLPGVITDRRNNQLSLNGQSGVTILINGRKQMLSMEEIMRLIENTAADNVEKIELITSPSAQYDADGGAGLINIVLKKNENDATKINLSATAGFGFREKAVGALNFSHGYKKVNVYAAYTYFHDVSRSGFTGSGTNDGIGNFKSQDVVFSGISKNYTNNHTLNFTSEYKFNDKTTIGADIIYSFNKSKILANNDVIWAFKNGDYLDFRALSNGKSIFQNNLNSVYLNHKISNTAHFNIDANFVVYSNSNPSAINGNYFDKQGQLITPSNTLYTNGNRGESISNIQVGAIKFDFYKKINEKLQVEIGLKFSHVGNRNDSKIERNINGSWEIDPRSQSLISGQELIGAVYSQAKWAINSTSNLQVGLRYENWNREISIYEDAFSISQLYPSLQYTKQINERTSLSFNYSRRISRPSYSDLISNLFYNDPTFIFSGNPLLKPTLTDVIKADLNLNGANLSLSYQYELNPILRYQITTNNTRDIGILSPQNLDYQKSLNIFLNYPFQIMKGWLISASSTTSFRNYKISYSLRPAEKSFVFQNVSFNQNFVLPKEFEIELSGWYNFPFFEGANSIKGFGVMSLGLAKKLKNNNGSFQLSLSDLFRSFKVQTHISGMTPIVFNINTVSTWRDESAYYQVVKLTYSRSFGKANNKKKYEANFEERGRL